MEGERKRKAGENEKGKKERKKREGRQEGRKERLMIYRKAHF